jgi:hypothetical protein
MGFDLLQHQVQDVGAHLTFHSPSECWKIDFDYQRKICPSDTGWCQNFALNLGLNWTGKGFTDLSQSANPL